MMKSHKSRLLIKFSSFKVIPLIPCTIFSHSWLRWLSSSLCDDNELTLTRNVLISLNIQTIPYHTKHDCPKYWHKKNPCLLYCCVNLHQKWQKFCPKSCPNPSFFVLICYFITHWLRKKNPKSKLLFPMPLIWQRTFIYQKRRYLNQF